VIGPQDTLQITVVDEPDFSGKFRVDADGTISYPYLNQIHVTGLTVDELRKQLVSGLSPDYIRNPQVRIEIDQFKSRYVMVVGAVRTPGRVALTGPTMSLLEALALAGSPSQNAANEIRIQRRARPGEKMPEPIVVNRRDIENGRSDLQVQDEDIINVPEAVKFWIQGQVRNTGQYVFEPGTTVAQAIILAGGLTDRGSDRGIKIERILNGRTISIDAKLSDKIQAGDIVIIRSRMF
jgi:polysaccharide export outer membrane protein